MTDYNNIPKWPFFPQKAPCANLNQCDARTVCADVAACKNKKRYVALEMNQMLSIILDDDELRDRLIKEFASDTRASVQAFPSAYHPDDLQRSRRFSHVPPGGHKKNAWIVTGYAEVRAVLANPEKFSNVPYAELGDRSFVLALDPFNTQVNNNAKVLYSRQRDYLNQLVQKPGGQQLSILANEAVRHAVLANLPRNRFDLTVLAEQAAVRYCGLWFGFASTDHVLIQKAANAGYRSLIHIILGRHFGSEPTVLPEGRAVMAQLTGRASELIAEYRKIAWKPRDLRGSQKYRESRAQWPVGVTPYDEWGLSGMGRPLLQRMALESHDFSVAELASMTAGLIAGTVGNVQTSVCKVIQQIFAEQEAYDLDKNIPANQESAGPLHDAIADAKAFSETVHSGALHQRVGERLLKQPPVPFLPRRAENTLTLGGKIIQKGDDVILWLSAASQQKKLTYDSNAFGLHFGAADADGPVCAGRPPAKPHYCLGKESAHALITAIVGTVLRLPSMAEVIDPFTGKPEGLEQRWGFSCESYPLTYKRALRLAQQPLNVIMPVKTPVDYHSSALQQIIHVGAPRVESVLKKSRHVHFAWFQLLDQGKYLALHTVYDGDFDAYIQDFALKVDDLFDLLFEHVEGAPRLPVAENVGSFVDVIRASNTPSVNGYFFSAYPEVEVGDIARIVPGHT